MVHVRYLRLKEQHSTMQKFEKLCAYAEELGISIEWQGQSVTIYDIDRDDNLPPLFLEDIEPNHWVSRFPPTTEYKIIYDNPEYLAQRDREQQEYLARRAEQERLVKEQERLAKEEHERRWARETEQAELNMLAKLKEKYESATGQ